MSEPENLLTRWAETLVRALVDAGVEQAVISPGSRSTPFVLAALRAERVEATSILDERAAAFFALGAIRVTGRPVALICTSGSAAAHYHPAVVEADRAELPLVIVSADRPRRLADAGASQTIPQAELFGPHARAFVELGEPIADARAFAALGRAVARAVAMARGPRPGPVQLNAPADKPLEPALGTSAAAMRLDAAIAAPARARSRVHPPRATPAEAALDEVAAMISEAGRPAIVAGPAPLSARLERSAILELAADAGLALFREATSQLRFGAAAPKGALVADAFDLWLDRLESAHPACPDLVIALGGAPISSAYARFIERCAPRRVVLGGTDVVDPEGSALVVLGERAAAIEGLRRRLPPRAMDGAFTDAARSLEAGAQRAIDECLRAAPGSEAAATRALLSSLPDGALLFLGNSLPVRHVERFGEPGEREIGLLHQRGAAGIDGAIAALAGAADRHRGPTVGLIGDVTFAHDVGSLGLLRRTTEPTVLVVLDNGGGRIFERLPIATAASEEELAFFYTPPEIDLEAAARAFGVAFESTDPPGLDAAMGRSLARRAATLVHVRVPPSGAEALERQLARRLREGP